LANDKPGMVVVVVVFVVGTGAVVIVVVVFEVGTGAVVIVGVTVLFVTRKRLEKVFAANLPLALRASLTVHVPEVLVVILPLFREHEPDTVQVFVPVELLEAIDEVA